MIVDGVRALAADEVARLPFEDVAAEIVARQPDPAKWTTDEAFVAADRYFLGEVEAETKALAAAVATHQAAFDVLTADGICGELGGFWSCVLLG